AEVLLQLHRDKEASAAHEQALAATNPDRRDDLQIDWAMALVRQRDYATAVAVVEAVIGQLHRNGRELYNAACVYALATGGAAHDAALDEMKKAELAESYGRRAVELLRHVIGQGFADVAHMLK